MSKLSKVVQTCNAQEEEYINRRVLDFEEGKRGFGRSRLTRKFLIQKDMIKIDDKLTILD